MKFSREAFLAFMFLLIIFSVAEGASWEVEKIIEGGGRLLF